MRSSYRAAEDAEGVGIGRRKRRLPKSGDDTHSDRMDRPQRNLDPIEFDDETIAALVELGEVLRGIHNELVASGFQIKDGIITPPFDEV